MLERNTQLHLPFPSCPLQASQPEVCQPCLHAKGLMVVLPEVYSLSECTSKLLAQHWTPHFGSDFCCTPLQTHVAMIGNGSKLSLCVALGRSVVAMTTEGRLRQPLFGVAESCTYICDTCCRFKATCCLQRPAKPTARADRHERHTVESSI